MDMPHLFIHSLIDGYFIVSIFWLLGTFYEHLCTCLYVDVWFYFSWKNLGIRTSGSFGRHIFKFLRNEFSRAVVLLGIHLSNVWESLFHLGLWTIALEPNSALFVKNMLEHSHTYLFANELLLCYRCWFWWLWQRPYCTESLKYLPLGLLNKKFADLYPTSLQNFILSVFLHFIYFNVYVMAFPLEL